MTAQLYSYWRSSAAYRVRIALNLKAIAYDIVPISLIDGEQLSDEYRAVNPQMLVPFFDDGRVAIGQSPAILEYLEEAYGAPNLLPAGLEDRARVRAFCNVICCDIHPLNNLRVLRYLEDPLEIGGDQRSAWYAHWIGLGFAAAEVLVGNTGTRGPYAFGAEPTLADVCLVPQIYNARRFSVPVDDYPRLVAIADALNELDAFQEATPERQPDAE